MFLTRYFAVLGLGLTVTVNAAAQDQTIVVDRPLQLCGTAQQFALATFDETRAAQLIAAAFGTSQPDPTTYYIIHATEFVPGRLIVAAEGWFVYHQPWQQRAAFWWFRDSRQLKRFRETRILGSSRVAMVYVYAHVPTFQSRSMLPQLGKFFLDRRTRTEADEDAAELKALAEAEPATGEADRIAEVQKRRIERLRRRRQNMEDQLPPNAEQAALSAAGAGAPDLTVIAWLEAERYLQALARQQDTFTGELELIDRDNGDPLVGLSPTLATTATFQSLAGLYYRIDITAKLPAPIQNLKEAAKLAFAAESAAARQFGVQVTPASVCAGQLMQVDHVPSDMLVKALVGGGGEPKERAKQLFDNEGRYWWDISFALPLDLRRDTSIDVDEGQVAAKEVEKADLFAVVNLGLPRDTKKIQWQLVPTFIYGIPITGKPLKHHLVGFSIGLNYVQLLGGFRFDRRQEVSSTIQDGTTVGIESAPEGEKWDRTWVWGINLPVNTVVKMFKK